MELKKKTNFKRGIAKNTAILVIAIAVIVVISIIILVVKNKNEVDSSQTVVGEVQTVTAPINYEESSDGSKTNTSKKVSETKKVGNITIEETKLVYIKGITSITAKVVNDGTEKENIKLKIKLMNSDGSVKKEIEAQAGKTPANATKYIKTSITEDIVDVSDISYEIVE